MKKILVSLPEGIYKLVRELKGKIGESDSEVVRSIVISFLSEKSYLSKGKNHEQKSKKRVCKRLSSRTRYFRWHALWFS
jgi:metal-responsive CopG/Arc/MetJ family transcriptional regulator